MLTDPPGQTRTGRSRSTARPQGDRTTPSPTKPGHTFSVELPGIEPELLLGKIHSELLFRSVWFRFSPARYLRFRFRVLTASMLTIYCPDSQDS